MKNEFKKVISNEITQLLEKNYTFDSIINPLFKEEHNSLNLASDNSSHHLICLTANYTQNDDFNQELYEDHITPAYEELKDKLLALAAKHKLQTHGDLTTIIQDPHFESLTITLAFCDQALYITILDLNL